MENEEHRGEKSMILLVRAPMPEGDLDRGK